MIRYMLNGIKWFEQGGFPEWSVFEDVVHEQLPSLKQALAKKIIERQKSPETLWGSVMYNMEGRSYWKQMIRDTPWIQDQPV